MLKTGVVLDNDELLNQLTNSTKKKFSDAEGELIEKIIETQEFDSDEFKENLITFSDVLRSNKRVLGTDYIKAVQFCSHMASGASQYSAYCKTFPDRVAKKKSDGTVRASASIYHKTELVQKILRMAQVPMHLMFMSERFKAVQVLVGLMSDADSTDRIKMESADKLLHHVKAPEESKLTVDLNVKSDALSNLENAIEQLAMAQIKQVEDGMSTAHDIVDAEITGERND